MVKLPRMGRPPFLKPHHVKQDDLVEIVDEPYVRSAEDSRFERPRGYAVVRLLRTGELYTWGFNSTTWDRLLDAFGDDSTLWRGKKVKVKIETQTVRGEQRQVIFGIPYREPQQKLPVDRQSNSPLDADLIAKVKALPLEQKKALLEALNESPAATETF
ncbi:MAG: hypothetical protein NZ932_04665 [Candidatus Bathyarchaeota archaeon]|nr:hypothetical protein [Candidatus Bathyarchaeota archaeon]